MNHPNHILITNADLVFNVGIKYGLSLTEGDEVSIDGDKATVLGNVFRLTGYSDEEYLAAKKRFTDLRMYEEKTRFTFRQRLACDWIKRKPLPNYMSEGRLFNPEKYCLCQKSLPALFIAAVKHLAVGNNLRAKNPGKEKIGCWAPTLLLDGRQFKLTEMQLWILREVYGWTFNPIKLSPTYISND